MATSTIGLTIGSGVPPDGSASNAAPGIIPYIGTNANPKRFGLQAVFSATVDNHLWFSFNLPGNYVSGGTVRLSWACNATTGNCVWACSVGAITPADADTHLEHVQNTASTVTTGANATEANRLIQSTMSPNMDSAAANDVVWILVYRDADNGSDTLSVTAQLISASLDYTS